MSPGGRPGAHGRDGAWGEPRAGRSEQRRLRQGDAGREVGTGSARPVPGATPHVWGPHQGDVPRGGRGAHVQAGLPDGAAAVQGPSEGAHGAGGRETRCLLGSAGPPGPRGPTWAGCGSAPPPTGVAPGPGTGAERQQLEPASTVGGSHAGQTRGPAGAGQPHSPGHHQELVDLLVCERVVRLPHLGLQFGLIAAIFLTCEEETAP